MAEVPHLCVRYARPVWTPTPPPLTLEDELRFPPSGQKSRRLKMDKGVDSLTVPRSEAERQFRARS